MGRWKAIRSGENQPLQLYDLDSDIGETTDVAAAHADVVTKIESYLATARTQPREHFNNGWEP